MNCLKVECDILRMYTINLKTIKIAQERITVYNPTKEIVTEQYSVNQRKRRKQGKKMVDLHPTTVVMLSINGFNIPIKRQRMSNWIKMHDTAVCSVSKQILKTQIGLN